MQARVSRGFMVEVRDLNFGMPACDAWVEQFAGMCELGQDAVCMADGAEGSSGWLSSGAGAVRVSACWVVPICFA